MDDEDDCEDVDDVHEWSHSCETQIDHQNNHYHYDDDMYHNHKDMYDNMTSKC